MKSHTLAGWCALVLLLGCSTPKDKAGTSASGTTKPSSSAPSAASGSATVKAPPRAPLDDGRVTHLVGPAPKVEPCAPLANKDGQLHSVAAAVRKLVCEPALYFQTTAEVRKVLALPKGITFSFNGTRSAQLKLQEPPLAKALAAALGISAPMIAPGRRGAWAMRNWRMGSNRDNGELDIWAPGVTTIAVDYDASSEDKFDTVKPLPDETKSEGWINVRMPATVLKVKDDEAALAQLIAALNVFSEAKDLTSAPPEEAAKNSGLTGERFRVSRRSIGTGDSAVHSIDVWTARTYLGADLVLKALNLKGKIEPHRAHDSNEYHLYGGKGPSGNKHSYQNLTLTLRFDKADAADGKGYVLDGITIH